MSKRKSSKRTSSSESFKSKGSRSFWTNAGQSPVPAINFNRPFDFQEGIVPINGKRLPLATGSLQYFVTNIEFDDQWPTCTAFKTAATKLYQAIRQNLRSNLSYSIDDLVAYLANVSYLQALFSIVSRDFRYMKFRDSQHPTFEHIWGSKAVSSRTIYDDAITISEVEKKDYLKVENYATSLTYMENVLAPKASLLLLPPAISEYLKWLFDAIFVDNLNPALSQYYWNEFTRLPQYEIVEQSDEDGKTVRTIAISHYIDSNTVSLEDIANICELIAAKYGVIIADLKRAGAQMVLPAFSLPSSNPTMDMKYDQMYLTALENAYTGGYLTNVDQVTKVRELTLPDFFLVDILEGASSDQATTMLSLSGGLIKDSTLVSPMRVTNQYALVKIDEECTLADADTWVEGSGVQSVDKVEPGIYAMAWSSDFSNTTRITIQGIPERVDSITAGQNYTWNGFDYSEPLSMSYDVSTHVDMSWFDNANHYFYQPIGYFSNSQTNQIGMMIKATDFEFDFPVMKTKADAKMFLVRKIGLTGLYPRFFDSWDQSGMTRVFDEDWNTSVSMDLRYIPNMPGFTEGVYNDGHIISIGNNFVPSIAAVGMNGCVFLNDFFPGWLDIDGFYFSGLVSSGDVSVIADKYKQLGHFIIEECNHHIPLWNVEAYLLDDTTTSTFSDPACLKETHVTSSYNSVELEALLYSMMYSLFFVHTAEKKDYKKA